jgi:hypothetical protein
VVSQNPILRCKDLEIVDDFVKEVIGESGTKHWKKGYIISLRNWIQADPWSDVKVSVVDFAVMTDLLANSETR